MADKNQKNASSHRPSEYRFPEGRVSHVGTYGVNEKDPALAEFEYYEAEQIRKRRRENERRRREEECRRRKRRNRVILISVFAVLLVAAGTFGAVAFLGGEEEPVKEDLAAVNAEIDVPEEVTDPETTEPEEETPAVTESAPQSDEFSYTMVINRSYPLSDEAREYVQNNLVTIEGKQMEAQAGEALGRMVADMRAQGLDIIIQSGYRTAGDQEYLYDRQIGRQGGNEYKAGTISAVPGTSEHEAGLAVDLSVDGSLTEAFSYTEQGKWLEAHCAEYGFILRYPDNPEFTMDTGIIFEPWHFRYVGSPEEAQKIMASGQSMERYYNKMLKPEHIDPYKPYLQ